MTNEELFDAYRQVVSERDQLRQVGDDLWNDLIARGASTDYALVSTDLATESDNPKRAA